MKCIVVKDEQNVIMNIIKTKIIKGIIMILKNKVKKKALTCQMKNQLIIIMSNKNNNSKQGPWTLCSSEFTCSAVTDLSVYHTPRRFPHLPRLPRIPASLSMVAFPIPPLAFLTVQNNVSSVVLAWSVVVKACAPGRIFRISAIRCLLRMI